MPAKQLHFQQPTRDGLLAGVRKVAGMVKLTMGPRGQNVILERQQAKPLVTKDGVTVAEYVTLEDGVEEMGSQLVVDAAQRTADQAGDGTTAACVLSEAIFEQGHQELSKKRSLIKMSDGIDAAVNMAEKFIKEHCTEKVDDADELVAVATIASNHDHALGKLIGEAMDKTGKDGCIIVQEGGEDKIEYTEGMQVRSGMKSPYFANQPNRTGLCEFKDALVFIANKNLSSARALAPLMQLAVDQSRALVIFGKDFSPEVMQLMIVNRMRQNIAICAVRIPDFADHQADIARDVAAVTSATAITDDQDYDLSKIGAQGGKKWTDFLGNVSLFRATKSECVLIQDPLKKDAKHTERVNSRLQQAKDLMASYEAKNTYERDKVQRRIASLSGGVAKLVISAKTEAESGQKKARVEDALYAVKAAAEHGIVAGGGSALFFAGEYIAHMATLEKNSDYAAGMHIVASACKEPLIQIARNADEKFVHTIPAIMLKWFDENIKPDAVRSGGPMSTENDSDEFWYENELDIDTRHWFKGSSSEEVREEPGVEVKVSNGMESLEMYWFGWDADSNQFGSMYLKKIIDPAIVPITALRNAASVAKLLLNTGGVIEYLQEEKLEQGLEGHGRGKIH